MTFVKATKHQSKLRLAIIGPSGSGKTYTALGIAAGLAQGGKVAVVDTERGSASLYADHFKFDVLTLDTFSPLAYVEAIEEAEKAGYAVIVIDSLSHAWASKGGALEMVNNEASRLQSKNSYTAWRNVTPIQDKMIDAIIGCKVHIICTMRSKMEYVMEKDDKGKTTIRKIGLQPIQREGLDYEFTLCGDIDQDHKLIVSKSRCPAFADAVIEKPGAQFAEQLLSWLNDGAPEKAEQKTLPGTQEPPKADSPPPQPLQVSDEQKRHAQVKELVKDCEPDAVAWCVKNGWIKGGEHLGQVSDENNLKVLSRPAAFLTAIKLASRDAKKGSDGKKVQ
jgi:hypothetical protein